jgi:hypothetical protein
MQRQTATPSHIIKRGKSISIPNARPENISVRLHRIISSNRVTQCIFYGVQDVTKDSHAAVAITTAKEAVADTVRKAAKTVTVDVSPVVKAAKTVAVDSKRIRFITNARPENIGPALASFIDRSSLLQCIFYGVQEVTANEDDLETSSRESLLQSKEVRQPPVSTIARPRPSQQVRGVFKDLDIATAALAVGDVRCQTDVPPWY